MGYLPQFGLHLIILFGSQARKFDHRGSDVDIAFFPSREINEEKLYQDFTCLLKRADIDLINLFTAHNHILRYEILSKGEVLYEEEAGLKSRMEGQSYIDFIDFQHYFALRSAILDKKLTEMTA